MRGATGSAGGGWKARAGCARGKQTYSVFTRSRGQNTDLAQSPPPHPPRLASCENIRLSFKDIYYNSIFSRVFFFFFRGNPCGTTAGQQDRLHDRGKNIFLSTAD